MSDEQEYFIHNIQEYNEYKKLKPIKYYKYKKVKFICSTCGKESEKTFRKLSIPFMCRYCTNRQAQLRPEVQLKKIQTCQSHFGVNYPGQSDVVKERIKESNINTYGVENVWQSSEIKEKIKQTNLEKYGVEYISQNPDIKQKVKTTNIERYGVSSFTQSDEYKEKLIKTNMERYGVPYTFQNEEIKQKCKESYIKNLGVENPSQSEEIKLKKLQTNRERYNADSFTQTQEYIIKSRKTNNEKYGKDSYSQCKESKERIFKKFFNALNMKLDKINLTIFERNKRHIKIKCLKCNEVFSMSSSACNALLKKHNGSFCPNCSRIATQGRSFKEKEIYDFLKTIYSGTIIRNNRTILSGKELDFYLPDKNIAIEFDGTYWHADERFYAADDIIKHANITAKEIWERDKLKNILCEQKHIDLIRIKEYDWDNNKEEIINTIKTKIFG